MPIRAVIIGNENYSHSTDLAPKLAGTLDNAEKFKDWLISKKSVLPANILSCADATKAEIAAAFRQLVDAGKDDTEELYVFFSGHGFSFNDNPWRQKPADVLVGTDFQNLHDSGDACLKLDEIQLSLWNCLGAGAHFCFIDACRNTIKASQVNPGTLGWTRDPSNTGQPKVFTLFSTARGSVAAVASGFGPALVDGLSGRGRAKQRQGTKMFVTFESLCRYLEDQLQQQVDPEAGGGPGRILEISPIPDYQCQVYVENAAPTDVFTLLVHNALQQTIRGPESFTGPQTSFAEKPDDYYVQVTHPLTAVQPVQPAEADLYEDCTVRFRKTSAPTLPASAMQPAALSVAAAPQSSLVIRNLKTDDQIESGPGFSGNLPPGEYQVRMVEGGRNTVRRARVLLRPGASFALDIGRRESSRVKDSLIRAIPGGHDDRVVDFSESLGPMANTDLGLWLSLAGASRIVREWADFSKLKYLPLETFDNVKPGDCPIYVLLGLENLPKSVSVGISKNSKPEWKRLEPVPGLVGIYENRTEAGPGSHLVSVSLEGKAPLTVATFALPNRATLFTVAQDPKGVVAIYQYILPLSKLQSQLTAHEQQLQPSNPLRAIQFIASAQKDMARRRSIQPTPENKASAEDLGNWYDLLFGKWFDPIMAVMASYELIRTNQFSIAPGGMGGVVLDNLRTYFGALPDVEAIAKLAGAHYTRPKVPPLFFAGLAAFGDYSSLLPLPASRLNFSSLWTAWIGAVE